MTDVLALVGIVAVVAAVAGRQVLRAKIVGGPGVDAAPSIYELAHLAGGPERVALTAAAYLVWTGTFEVRAPTRTIALTVRPEKTGDDLRPVEIAMINAASMAGVPANRVLVAGRYAATETAAGPLAVPPSAAGALFGLPMAVGALVIVGMAALAVIGDGLGSIGPLALIAGAAAVVLAYVDRPTATAAGREALRNMRSLLDDDLEIASAGVTSLSIGKGMRFVAIYGREVLNGELSGLRSVL